ncbi:cell division site-positioning protein MapZ family protein [Streptococcus tangpeifui]|uniref:cell division site-positioning protein MapZ family protein n=1 Tax=Streptococcus tangpeifui TaxID=2709400 RepID=UPI0013EB5885|nr:cell division site-positioning protein MapZ family protein [Streptococcus sp. ZJ1593]
MAKENENGKLDFEEAKDMTVQEALQKHKEIEAGVTDDDGVLDKYIKQHRDQVVAEKYEAQTSDFENIDTSSLDSFIQKQREELANQGLLSKEEPESQAQNQASETIAADQKDPEFLDETRVFAPAKEGVKSADKTAEDDQSINDEDYLVEPEEKSDEDEDFLPEEEPSKKKKAGIVAGLVAILVVIVGTGFGLNYWNKQSTTTVSSGASTKGKDAGKTDYKAFQKSYKSFFIDDKQTQLKNSQFSQLVNLNKTLKKLDGTTYYKDAKSDYSSLNKQITAIKTVNKLFDKDMIVDGKLAADAKAKKDADFDSLTDDTLKTGNSTLDKLIQEAIKKGKEQQKASQTPASSSSSQSGSAPADNGGQNTNTGSSNNASIPSGGNIRQSGITSYDPSILQRDRSRVPYNADAVKDVNNAAWIFGDGILEKVVSTSQSRGYFSGNDYILEPVNIVNGHGYYNMYKSDGTYLFSVNAQTGYFVGNASGNSDNLDF